MYIYTVRTILSAIRRFANMELTTFQLADALGIKYPALEVLLITAGIIDLHADILPDIDYQDVVNVIQLYFSMSKKVSFTSIDWHEKQPPPD